VHSRTSRLAETRPKHQSRDASPGLLSPSFSNGAWRVAIRCDDVAIEDIHRQSLRHFGSWRIRWCQEANLRKSFGGRPGRCHPSLGFDVYQSDGSVGGSGLGSTSAMWASSPSLRFAAPAILPSCPTSMSAELAMLEFRWWHLTLMASSLRGFSCIRMLSRWSTV
jgi:hypothetical protein